MNSISSQEFVIAAFDERDLNATELVLVKGTSGYAKCVPLRDADPGLLVRFASEEQASNALDGLYVAFPDNLVFDVLAVHTLRERVVRLIEK